MLRVSQVIIILMKIFFYTAVTLGLLSANSASAIDVKTYSHKEVDIRNYKTYQWMPIRVLTSAGVVEDDDQYAPMIRSAIEKQMAKTGLTRVASGGDLQLLSVAVRDASAQLEAFIYGWGFTGLENASWGMPIATVGRYNYEGTLVICLYDEKIKKGAWMGIAKAWLGKPSALAGTVDKGVAKMFSKYPNKTK